jgi:hypothetical protein
VVRVVAVLLLIAGCAPVEPWIEVGSGDGGFASLDDGDVLRVENGSQGGRHVWVALRADGIDPGSQSDADAMLLGDRPLVDLRLEGPDGVYSLDMSRHIALPAADGPGYELSEQLLPFRLYATLPEDWQNTDWEAVERELGAETFELTATLEDAEGVQLVDRRTVGLQFPE